MPKHARDSFGPYLSDCPLPMVRPHVSDVRQSPVVIDGAQVTIADVEIIRYERDTDVILTGQYSYPVGRGAHRLDNVGRNV